MNAKKEERLVRIVRREQEDPKKGPPEIRRLARLLGERQRDVLQTCEDLDLCVNVGIAVAGYGSAEFDRIGDYTVEDLDEYRNEEEG